MLKNKRAGRITPLWVAQNYLTGTKTIKRCIDRASLDKHDHVIEIGPGKGHITRVLINKCRQVTAIEKDNNLYKKLKSKDYQSKGLQLFNADFLKWSLPVSGSYKVFSNIPFCITTDIIRKLTECKNPPAESWLIVEKGAAKRFLGIPKETLRSLMLKPMFDIKIKYYFLREDFHPKPGVDIVLLHLKRKEQPDIPVNQVKSYEKFISVCLKYGKHGLRRFFTKKQTYRVLKEAGINNFTPSETLYIQWLCLFRCYRAVGLDFYNER